MNNLKDFNNIKGLSFSEVNKRYQEKQVNTTTCAVGKSVSEIIFSNLFSFFNILLFVLAGFLIATKNFTSIFFLAILIPNILIGLIQDLYARHLMKKLKLLTAPKVTVIREGKKQIIDSNKIVLNDVIILKAGEQICADGVILQGNIAVNESLLTGESDNIYKQTGSSILAGSYVTSGTAYAEMTKVGKDTYIQGIQEQANKFKRSPSKILKSLKQMFAVLGSIIIVLGLALVISYAAQGKFAPEEVKASVKQIAGSMVSMIPSGLFLLTSVALATGVITLARKRTAVQELYSIEMLARVDVLCVDKTGTITNGSMKVQRVIPLLSTYNINQIDQTISNILNATKDDNLTAAALKEHFSYGQTSDATAVLPFNSDNKYSGATFRGKGTFLLGALDFLNITNRKGVEFKVKEFTSKGYRVLVLGHSALPIKGESFNGILTPVALIVLKDNLRPGVIETFKWFKENSVDIKVISGDDPLTVSEIAKEAGVNKAERYISLVGKSLEEVELLAEEYTVFGRVSPEQKEVLIQSLKRNQHTVAMTGDGVNDILALKRADCSIAMASGSPAARNVSHIVLLDSDFNRLPDVVAEGRRVINNIQRTSSLFLVKTTFTILLTIFFFIMSLINNQYSYPLSTNSMYIWELFAIGLPSFFLALQPNTEPIHGDFLKNIFKKAIPAGCVAALIVMLFMSLYLLDKNNIGYFGFADNYDVAIKQIVSASVISFSTFSLVFLYKICGSLSKKNIYRGCVFIVFVLLAVLVTLGDAILRLVVKTDFLNLFEISWNLFNGQLIYEAILITLLVSSIYLFTTFVRETLARGKKND